MQIQKPKLDTLSHTLNYMWNVEYNISLAFVRFVSDCRRICGIHHKMIISTNCHIKNKKITHGHDFHHVCALTNQNTACNMGTQI